MLTPRARRTAVYVALVLLAGLGIFRVEQAVDDQRRITEELHAFVSAEARQDRLEDAERCVTAWEVRAEIRASDVIHNQAAAEALIEVVQPDDQAIVDLYRAVLARRLEGASDLIEDPDCDLDHAQRVVAVNQE